MQRRNSDRQKSLNRDVKEKMQLDETDEDAVGIRDDSRARN